MSALNKAKKDNVMEFKKSIQFTTLKYKRMDIDTPRLYENGRWLIQTTSSIYSGKYVFVDVDGNFVRHI